MLMKALARDGESFPKHVATIHCSGDLTLFQRKIINCLLYNAFPTLKNEVRFKINIRDLLALLGLQNNDYAYLREAFRNIRKTDISWNLTSESFKKKDKSAFEAWIECSWLAWAMSDGSTIHYEFPAPLREYLKDPSVYSSISLAIQRRFTSKFALILYENCYRYIEVGKTKVISLETFRKIMGVKPDQYKAFRDLNARVLKPALKQVNELTDMDVEPIFSRQSRKIAKVQFLVKRKAYGDLKKSTKSSAPTLTFRGEGRKTLTEADQLYYSFWDKVLHLGNQEQARLVQDFKAYLKEQIQSQANPSLAKILDYMNDQGWKNRVVGTHLMHYASHLNQWHFLF